MSAFFSHCGTYRFSLERRVQMSGPVYAYFGVNPSTAGATIDDATVRKWIGFTKVLGGSRFLVGNLFAYRSTDVKALVASADPVGPHNSAWLADIIRQADVLVPCWGSRDKLPKALHPQIMQVARQLIHSSKPTKVWGLTKSGDPLHPLMLGYSTPLIDWCKA